MVQIVLLFTLTVLLAGHTKLQLTDDRRVLDSILEQGYFMLTRKSWLLVFILFFTLTILKYLLFYRLRYTLRISSLVPEHLALSRSYTSKYTRL